jgi:hypothetical protein
MSNSTACEVEVVELDEEQGHAMFERVVKRAMGISADEFLSRWDSGEWADANLDEVPGLVEVWMYLPAVR